MASEIQCSFRSGSTTYAVIRGGSINPGQIWRTDTNVWEAYSTVNYNAGKYTLSATEQGTASSFYTANFPTAIVAGVYSVVMKQQIGGSVNETDPTIAVGDIQWNGTALAPLSDTATSGQVGQIGPIRVARGTMIKPFPFKMVSSVDHLTPFVSGICSGQISRDGGAFGALQSGAFSEIGLGWFAVQALTSGDLLANVAALSFSAVGVSGGTADQRDMMLVLQRTSGQ